MVAAAGADELEQRGIAAFETALHDASRLAPQERRPAVAGLACRRECHGAAGPYLQPRVMLMVRVRCGDGGRPRSRPVSGLSCNWWTAAGLVNARAAAHDTAPILATQSARVSQPYTVTVGHGSGGRIIPIG